MSGVERLWIGDAHWVLRRDALANKAAAGASFVSRFLAVLPFNQAFSIYDATGELVARARREFHLSTTKDRVALFGRDGREIASAQHTSALGGRLSITNGPASLGDARFHDNRAAVEITTDALPPPHALLLAYALHTVWGHNPYAVTSTP